MNSPNTQNNEINKYNNVQSLKTMCPNCVRLHQRFSLEVKDKVDTGLRE